MQFVTRDAADVALQQQLEWFANEGTKKLVLITSKETVEAKHVIVTTSYICHVIFQAHSVVV